MSDLRAQAFSQTWPTSTPLDGEPRVRPPSPRPSPRLGRRRLHRMVLPSAPSNCHVCLHLDARIGSPMTQPAAKLLDRPSPPHGHPVRVFRCHRMVTSPPHGHQALQAPQRRRMVLRHDPSLVPTAVARKSCHPCTCTPQAKQTRISSECIGQSPRLPTRLHFDNSLITTRSKSPRLLNLPLDECIVNT